MHVTIVTFPQKAGGHLATQEDLRQRGSRHAAQCRKRMSKSRMEKPRRRLGLVVRTRPEGRLRQRRERSPAVGR